MLTFKEKMFVVLMLLIIVSASAWWIIFGYRQMTTPIPKKGGEYIEGILGQPLYLNPLLSQTSEADSDLAQLVYSGLFRYDNEGKLTADLADRYEVSEDQMTYTVFLKDGLTWHDGQPLLASDVTFTVTLLEDPAYKSPLRQNWQGVEVKQIDDKTISFTLKNPYFGFMDNLTVGILPKHIWEDIAPGNFALTEYNLRPIGSGPYRVLDFQKDSNGNILSYKLGAFSGYHLGEPFITKITFNFYGDDDALIAAYNKKEVMGLRYVSPEKVDQLKSGKSTALHELIIPRYFAAFFNQNKSEALANDDVKRALSVAVNRKEIIDTVLKGRGIAISSPFLPQMKEFNGSIDTHADVAQAQQILENAGWKHTDDSGIRKKDNVALKAEILTTDWPELAQTADILRNQWKEVGADITVRVLTSTDLQQNYIRPREYDSLLFGQAISFNPDLYSFWHSTQKRDPGLNFALFDNKDADQLLEDIRKNLNDSERMEGYRKLQESLRQENPAVFLYSPLYLYPVNNQVKGIDSKNINMPSWRFASVHKWFIKTKRIMKN